jgi:hypothetical protein
MNPAFFFAKSSNILPLRQASSSVRRTGDAQFKRREMRMARVSLIIVFLFMLCHTLKAGQSLSLSQPYNK